MQHKSFKELVESIVNSDNNTINEGKISDMLGVLNKESSTSVIEKHLEKHKFPTTSKEESNAINKFKTIINNPNVTDEQLSRVVKHTGKILGNYDDKDSIIKTALDHKNAGKMTIESASKNSSSEIHRHLLNKKINANHIENMIDNGIYTIAMNYPIRGDSNRSKISSEHKDTLYKIAKHPAVTQEQSDRIKGMIKDSDNMQR